MKNPSRAAMAELFLSDARNLGATRDIDLVFDELWDAYGASARHYHSREHIAECLAWLGEVRESLAFPAEVGLAIWFHDAIYATRPFSGSESRSADLALASCIRMGVAEPPARRIAAMVRATKDHTLAPGTGVEPSDALTLFDIDLATLGAGPLRYAEYERDVRAEYSWVPKALYVTTRARVLEGFAKRPRIYHHETLHERLEANARRNIERAVAELTAPLDVDVAHATDEYVVLTRSAALVSVFPWTELQNVALVPSLGGRPPRLVVAFGALPFEGADIAWDSPYAAELIDRIRSIPGYDRALEERGKTSRAPAMLYSRERQPAITGPLFALDRSAYR